MVGVDTNLLVYAHRQESPWHAAAAELLRDLAAAPAAWAIPWQCIHEFLSVATNPRLFHTPSPMKIARRQVEAWMESPRLRLLGETPGYWPELERILEQGRVVGGMVYDARIAAICLQNGVSELWSADRDFSRMAGLRVRNPLLGRG